MRRKIFVSINLPERDKKRLACAIGEWRNLPVKWVRESNLHITLLFLGFIPDEDLLEICQKVARAAEHSEIMDLSFKKIEFAPHNGNPKVIWLVGEASEGLKSLQENIEKALGIFNSGKKKFRPHVTLGRIRAQKWTKLPEKPTIEKKFSVNVAVESVDIMASDFSGDSQEYSTIESCLLK